MKGYKFIIAFSYQLFRIQSRVTDYCKNLWKEKSYYDFLSKLNITGEEIILVAILSASNKNNR